MAESRNIFKEGDFALALDQAAARYHKLALVVGQAGTGKSALLRSISQNLNIPLLNLGLELSQKLLPLTIRGRKLNASDIVTDLLDAHAAPRLAVDNTEIIFDPSLMLNPLGLLQTISRNRLLVWAWTGVIEEGHLTYAFHGHPEYHRIPIQDMTLIAMD